LWSHLGECQEVDKYPETPYIDGKIVSPLEGHLWGKIFLCAAERGFYPARSSGLDELCASKICDDEMARDIDEDILWFEVAVDDPCLMERIDRENQFGGVKEGRIGVKCTVSHQISEKVSSGTEVLSRVVSM
jgi:hypothetical protein